MVGMIDYYGLLNSDWISVRNYGFLQRLSLIQSPLQGIFISRNLLDELVIMRIRVSNT